MNTKNIALRSLVIGATVLGVSSAVLTPAHAQNGRDWVETKAQHTVVSKDKSNKKANWFQRVTKNNTKATGYATGKKAKHNKGFNQTFKEQGGG